MTEEEKEERRYAISSAENALERIKETFEEYRLDIEHEKIEEYHISGIIEEVNRHLSGWEKSAKEHFKNEILKAKEDAKKLSKELAIIYHSALIEEFSKRTTFRSGDVPWVKEKMSDSEKVLKKHSAFNQQIANKAHSALKNAAMFRAQKKIAEAEVAEGGMNPKKAEKLRGEARVMLKQDWAEAFPGEDPPKI